MFDEYLYVVKVYDTDATYEYQYGNLPHALAHYNTELYNGNASLLFRSKGDVFQRYNDDNTWG